MDFKNKGSIKVIDFGTAHCFNNDQKMHQTYGTAY